MKHYKELGIRIERVFDKNLPLVRLDREKIKQVLLNLCNNAVEAMPDGGTLTCKAYRTGGCVILKVSHTGTGIPEDLTFSSSSKPPSPTAL